MAGPKEIDARKIRNGLSTLLVGRKLVVHDTIDSTNTEARRLIREGHAADGMVIVAASQHAGRGRFKRKWFSLPRSAAISVILRADDLSLPVFVSMAAVSVCNAVYGLTGLRANITWPNDVTVDRRKLCGILVEREGEYAVVGIGVNVNCTMEEMPSELRNTATSIKEETGREVAVESLVRCLIEEMDTLHTLCRRNLDPLREEWRSLSSILGKSVMIVENGCSYMGRVVDLDVEGKLYMELPEGATRTFMPETAKLLE